MTRQFFTISLVILSISIANGQIAKNSELFLALKKQDSIFFERSFNLCDLEYLNKAIHKDLIFYHDQSGIQDRRIFLENTKKYICGDTIKKPIRKVEEQSLEVFPMYTMASYMELFKVVFTTFTLEKKIKQIFIPVEQNLPICIY